MLRKMRNYFDEKEYKNLYPAISRPGLFYKIAKQKVHKEKVL